MAESARIAAPDGLGGGGSSLRDSLRRERYIVSPTFDWIFFIGSPLLAVAVVLGAWQFFPAADIESYVLIYMALGHHVPTFLRAYGDPDEWMTNRFRLIVIPLCVLPLVGMLYLYNSDLLYLVFIWDQYHFVRQHYGVMRFYDAKMGILVKGANNLDQWLCFSGFVAIIAHSDLYRYVYTSSLYDLGVVVPTWFGQVLGYGSLAVVAGVGVIYAGNLLQRLASGQPVSGLKLACTATTYGVWTYAYIFLDQPLLAYPISSFFHCLQYDALAWHYNRKKAASLEAGGRSRFFRFIHSGRHVWLYVIAIFAYGFLSRSLGPFIPGLVFVLNRSTGILHYYFDSFIWRMRKPEFRRHI